MKNCGLRGSLLANTWHLEEPPGTPAAEGEGCDPLQPELASSSVCHLGSRGCLQNFSLVLLHLRTLPRADKYLLDVPTSSPPTAKPHLGGISTWATATTKLVTMCGVVCISAAISEKRKKKKPSVFGDPLGQWKIT